MSLSPSPSTAAEESPSQCLGLFRWSQSKNFRYSLFLLLVVAVFLDAIDDWKSWKEYIPVMTEATSQDSIWSSSRWTLTSDLPRQTTVNENDTAAPLLHPGHSQLSVAEKPPENENMKGTNQSVKNLRNRGNNRDRNKKAGNTKKSNNDKNNNSINIAKNQTSISVNNVKSNNTDTNRRPAKRVVLLGSRGKSFNAKNGREMKYDMWQGGRDSSHVSYGGPSDSLTNPYTLDKKNGESKCTPAAEWQTTFHPTCNGFHELDFVFDNDDGKVIESDHSMKLLGIGTSRDTWKIFKDDDVVVMKTLQETRDFTAKIYQHQIVDAVSSERLTASPYVLDIYGFCGPHVLNELGRPLDVKNVTMAEKLRYATNLAAGMADTHGIDGTSNPNMVHADLRHNNVMFSFETGLLKLSDYNQGYFLGWNKQNNEQCGYKPSFSFWHDRFAAPEECYGGVQTEKTDIYHLGGMIFYLLTEYKPYTFNRDDYYDRESKMSKQKGGKKPWAFPELPPRYQRSSDPTVKSMLTAIDMCLRFKPENRSSAKQVYQFLDKTLKSFTEQLQKQQ